jgi:hypothetical protein
MRLNSARSVRRSLPLPCPGRPGADYDNFCPCRLSHGDAAPRQALQARCHGLQPPLCRPAIAGAGARAKVCARPSCRPHARVSTIRRAVRWPCLAAGRARLCACRKGANRRGARPRVARPRVSRVTASCFPSLTLAARCAVCLCACVIRVGDVSGLSNLSEASSDSSVGRTPDVSRYCDCYAASRDLLEPAV